MSQAENSVIQQGLLAKSKESEVRSQETRKLLKGYKLKTSPPAQRAIPLLGGPKHLGFYSSLFPSLLSLSPH
jgi:hypothetical protein